MLTTRDASGIDGGLRRSPSARLKIAEFDPIAKAIEIIAVAAKLGFCRSVRNAKRMSLSIPAALACRPPFGKRFFYQRRTPTPIAMVVLLWDVVSRKRTPVDA